jgi:8-oxo-dGTP pyrophosphatase MutT (NUDIX family)
MPPEPVPAALAATLILLRDGPVGLEVLMVERHGQIAFAGGALVFPGGKLDPGDADPRLRPRCPGSAGLDAEALALRVAAVREAFEECGVLLAGARGEEAPVSASRAHALAARWREPLAADRVSLAEIAEQEDLWLACDRLVPFAHWITPEFMTRRFDTWFFLAAAPAGQEATHDGGESVDTRWIRPAEAVSEAQAGRLPIIFPTLLNLRKLAGSESASEALAAARASRVVTVLPRLERAADGSQHLRIPAEAGYGLDAAPVDALLPRRSSGS